MGNSSYLSNAEYEAVVRAGLALAGIAHATADKLLSMRWPEDAPGLLAELAARGRALSLDDLSDFLRDHFGEDIDPFELAFLPSTADAVLEWAVAHDRGRPTLAAVVLEEAPQVIEQAQRAGAYRGN